MNIYKIPASDGTSVNQEFFVLHFQTCTMLLCMVWCNFVLYRVIHLPSCIHLLIIIRIKRNLTMLLPWSDFPDHIHYKRHLTYLVFTSVSGSFPIQASTMSWLSSDTSPSCKVINYNFKIYYCKQTKIPETSSLSLLHSTSQFMKKQ